MPPKGWRKNTEGHYPHPNKDQDLVSIDEILFPRATVQKLAKNIISASSDNESGSNMIIAKDSMTALQRSSTVFVSYLMFQARKISKQEGRKTVNAQDILNALEKAEFSGFVPEVKQKLGIFENNVALRKKNKTEKKASKLEETVTSPLGKRLKDNDKQTIQRANGADIEDDLDAESDEEATKDILIEEETNENVVDEDDEKEEKEEKEDVEQEDEKLDETEGNPIALLSKDEEELRGEEVADENEDEDQEQNSSEDER